MDWLSWVNSVSGLLTALCSTTALLWGGWQMIIKPIKRGVLIITETRNKLDKTIAVIDNEILPFIKSMTGEFSKNSGKSIKDQITRIDQNTKLSELRIKLIATNLVTTGIFECDSDGGCVWVNKALAEMFGMEREEMMGNGWLTAIHDNERSEVWQDWNYSVNNKIPYEDEYSIYNKHTEKIFKVRVVAIANKSDTGKTLGYFGTVVRLTPP